VKNVPGVPAARCDLPIGTVTFLFTDVEGSTRLLHELGAEGYAEALAAHRRVLRAAFAAHGGVEVDTQGDAFFVAFPTAPGALRAATASLDGLAGGPISVRIGLHTGTPLLTGEGYVGEDVHRAARIAASGHGGQVLVSTSTAALVDSDVLHDLGEHRLKDLSAPERIYQLGEEEFPALKSLYRTNLPIPATPFLGREKELTEVLELLSRDDVRLLTLTGPGGTGKTRLALQAAAAAGDAYSDGVYWVPLAPLRDPQLVLQGAAQAVGADDALAEHIADKRLLLLLDNFEHLTAAATDAAALLGVCPNLRLLVTSREPLHVRGEQEYPVPPLAPGEAVDFFTIRARGIRPDFAPDDAVPQICSRLDDLPLALELAAARVKALSPQEILARLEQRLPLLTGGARDAPERQRTLRATIEWSHDLLSGSEQRLFARLAVFRGGCGLEAAEDICGADLDTLQSLVDKSLLRHNDGRYWMLETIREYAAERLEDSAEAEEMRDRHAEYYLALAEEAEPALLASQTPTQWLDRLESEHDNLRVSLDWLEASGRGELALRLAGAASPFWHATGQLTEGRRRLESALRGSVAPTSIRAKALTGAASMAVTSGDNVAGRMMAGEALELHRTFGDTSNTATVLHILGLAAGNEEDFAGAKPLFEESARLFRELGDRHGAMNADRSLAWMYSGLGDRERARELHESNLLQARELRDELMESMSLIALAMLAIDDGSLGVARSMLQASLRIDREQRYLPSIAFNLCRFARLHAVQGKAWVAATFLSSADALLEEIGARPSWLVKMNDETRTIIHTQLTEAAFADAWEQGTALRLDDALALALDTPG
jgi:predicted ATPase/class 3 adenylate cyclase